MAGYGGIDDASVDAMIFVENQVGLCRMLLPSGESSTYCIECGELISKERRLALPGVKTCIPCQNIIDKQRPQIKVNRHIL